MELTEVDRKKFDLWTARDMTFAIKDKGIRVIPRFTKCHKPAYTKKIKKYLERMEAGNAYRPPGNPAAVCVKLEGQLRYVWRTNVLTQKEYDDVKSKERDSLRVFCKKSAGAVGKS